jgi:hypothetical protein
MADTQLDRTRNSLERIQSFDVSTLPRASDLGARLNFEEAVEPAARLVNLFRQFPIQFLGELPPNQQVTLQQQADSLFNIFDQILKFDPSQTPDSFVVRNSLIANLKGQYQPSFDALFALISYGSSRLRDFAALEREARAAVQSAADSAAQLTAELEKNKQQAERILEDVRNVAAETGVSQQAIYFQQDSNEHDQQADTWQTRTIWLAVALGIYAAISATFHKLPWLEPKSTYDAFQLGLSKVLIFVVIAYMLLLSARNFLAHKHNAIVNRHRQNALLTFNALVDAAKAEDRKDIVLTYAAACIFSPQETGYTKAGSGQPELPASIIQALPKAAAGGG